MTYIEFFEKDATENICACLTKAPERLILLGDNRKLMQKHIERYKPILAARGIEAEFLCRNINKNQMQDIINTLTELIETYEDCVFDLTGGDDLYLVAMGIVFERYKEKGIQMHRFNIRNNTIIDCDQDGQTILEGETAYLSVEENIRLYGGDIVYERDRKNSTLAWDMNSYFKKDIDDMWDICKKDVKMWNTQIGFLAAVEAAGERSNEDLTTVASVARISAFLESIGRKYAPAWRFLYELQNMGLITWLSYDSETVSITYKNQQVKRCLTKAGQILEMKIYKAALEASAKDGSPVYNDVMTGVYIDWDGNIHTEEDAYDTENEVDVMMMHSLVPVFVSCKNGSIGMDELYKLNSVADRFGGKYARKVLVATALDEKDFSEYLRQRAKDMNIRLFEGVQHLDEATLKDEVRKFWTN